MLYRGLFLQTSFVGAEAVQAESAGAISRSLPRIQTATLVLALLSPCVLLIHGYHPYSEDAAIYVAGIKKMLHPSLYTMDAPFVMSHARLSVFSHLLATVAYYLRLPLEPLLLFTYLASIFTFLYACRALAVRMFESESMRWTATCLAGICLTMPVAATALLVMDPYVTARSFSTPFTLLAVVACLDRSWRRMGIWWLLTALMHPLMGIYLAAFLFVLALIDRRLWRIAIAVCIFGLLTCAIIFIATLHAPVSVEYREAVLSRGYYFLAGWRWFEIIGLGAPLLLLGIAAIKCGLHTTIGKLAATSVLIGSTAWLASFCFVHQNGPYFLARLTILRTFHTIYVLGLVMLGGFLARYFITKRLWIGSMLLAAATTGMFLAQRATYPASSHIELPDATPANPWQQAFLWIRSNTPQNAVFAADASLLNSPGEDSQGFRAISERSVLMDNKDEGVASLFPAIAGIWKQRRDAQLNLNTLNDQERLTRLRPFKADWVLLSAKATTSFLCPYRNAVVTVCQITR